jgi:hypothetical protein
VRDREDILRELVSTFDEGAMARAYRDDDGVLTLPSLLPEPLLGEMVAEGRALAARAVRKKVPFLRTAGAVHHAAIEREAPALTAVHRSPSLMGMFERVTGVPLEHRDPKEAHQSALYTYTRAGDWMDWHYDECGCPPNDSFSTIIGLVDNSSSRLEVKTGSVQRSIHTVPGTFAFFCGTRAHHRVTPLAEGEERITFAFTYIRRGKSTRGIYNVRMKLGNALVYFGLGHLFE